MAASSRSIELAEAVTPRPFIQMHHYVTAKARDNEKRRIRVAVALANEKGVRPIVRVPAETRKRA